MAYCLNLLEKLRMQLGKLAVVLPDATQGTSRPYDSV